jgi:hypothetical protein
MLNSCRGRRDYNFSVASRPTLHAREIFFPYYSKKLNIEFDLAAGFCYLVETHSFISIENTPEWPVKSNALCTESVHEISLFRSTERIKRNLSIYDDDRFVRLFVKTCVPALKVLSTDAVAAGIEWRHPANDDTIGNVFICSRQSDRGLSLTLSNGSRIERYRSNSSFSAMSGRTRVWWHGSIYASDRKSSRKASMLWRRLIHGHGHMSMNENCSDRTVREQFTMPRR